MAQVVKLKRTSVQGRVPTISNLELGELAINTHDGRIFFEKDDGTLSIQEILTTNSQNSGSFNLQGAISASSLSISGDTTIGGNLTLGGNITIGDETTDVVSVTAGFSGSLLPNETEIYDLGSTTKKWNELHVETTYANLLRLDEAGNGLRMTNIGAFDKDVNNNFIIFSNQDLVFSTDGDSGVALTLDETTKDANFVGAVTASHFVGDGSGLTNVITEVSEQNSVTASFSNQEQIQVTHNFDSRNIHVSVYDNSHELIIPESVTLTTTDTVDIDLSAAGSGYVVVAKGGHLLDGVYVDNVTKVSDTFTNQTSYIVNHSFGTKDVIVTVYDTNDAQIIPQSIVTSTLDTAEIGFENPTSGRVVVVKAGHLISGSITFNNITEVPNLISGSVTGSNVVGSDTITSIETMTSASYAAITPVSGTLYIITD